MIRRGLLLSLAGAAMAVLAAGCGGAGGGSVSLAEAGGTVTFKGAPLAGASVTFVPENGPVATGTTDLSGKFKLTSGGQPGAAIGPCKATVTAWEGGVAPSPTTTKPASKEEHMKQMGDMRAAAMKTGGAATPASEAGSGPKSIIPVRYGNADSANLVFTVDKDGSKNDFKIALTE